MTIVLSTPPYSQFYDASGNPLNGGLVYTYLAGTLTARPTYTDQGGGTQAANPVVLDSAGRAEFWLDNSASYKFIVKDSGGTTIHTTDNVAPFSTDSGLAVLGTIAANTIVGNNTGSAATPTALTIAQATAMLSSSLPSGFKNFLINGDFKVWQRGTTFALTTSALYGSADRWAVKMNTVAAGVANQSTSVPTAQGFIYSLKIGRTAASALTNQITLAQPVETIDSTLLAGRTVTLSFWAKCGADFSGTSSLLGVALITGTGTDQGAAGMMVGSWTGNAAPINTTDTLSTTWQQFQHSGTLASTVTELGPLFYYVPVGTAGADDNVYITGVQLEAAAAATAFDTRGFGFEANLCRRFYEKSFIYVTAPAQSAGVTSAYGVFLPTGATGTFGSTVTLIPKRTAPTITTYNPALANANWRDTTNGADRVVTVGTAGQNSFLVTGAAGAAGSTNLIHWSADAELA